MRYPILICLAALSLGACASPAVNYKAPSPAKLNAATTRLYTSIKTAHTNADKARTHIQTAKKSSADVKTKLADLKKKAPKELQDDIDAIIESHTAESDNITNAAATQDELEKNFAQIEKDKAQVESEKNAYYLNGEKLAQEATKESVARYQAQSQLIKDKFYGWVWKIGTALAIIVVILIVVLSLAGKLALKL